MCLVFWTVFMTSIKVQLNVGGESMLIWGQIHCTLWYICRCSGVSMVKLISNELFILWKNIILKTELSLQKVPLNPIPLNQMNQFDSPAFTVLKPSSSTIKCRVAFNGSSKYSAGFKLRKLSSNLSEVLSYMPDKLKDDRLIVAADDIYVWIRQHTWSAVSSWIGPKSKLS